MKKDKTNIVNTPFSSKKARIVEGSDREYRDLDFYVYGADFNNLRVTDYQRVLRNGSYRCDLDELRSDWRGIGPPNSPGINRGFRLVLQRRK